MTERSRRRLQRTATSFRVGPSAISVTPEGLTIDIDEISAPIPGRIRGQVHLQPIALPDRTYQLDAAGRHSWRPIAPLARVKAEFTSPGMRFSGGGYLDSNWGSEPLETGFRFWTWSRGIVDDHAAIIYDCQRRDGSTFHLALKINADGAVTSFDAPPASPLPTALWRMSRPTHSDATQPARLIRTLEDAPFYTRSMVAASIDGKPVTLMHESLSLDRFSHPLVQCMLPFRMPRWG